MLEKFKTHIADTFQNLQEQPFLLACSGGIDSVVMTHLCTECKLDFSIAHCNFQLRGEDSLKDESFVRILAEQLNKTIYITHFDTKGYIEQHKTSVQIAARNLRYTWFGEIVATYNLGAIVTAHHLDDNLETFLINLSRGTGIDGLTGIPEKTATLSRPLLKFSREEIFAYAKINKLVWREDFSNNDTKYLRNKIRHKIVPLLKTLNPSFLYNFQRTQTYLNEVSAINDTHIKFLRTKLFTKEDNFSKIAITSIQQLFPLKAYIYALFNAYGFTEWDNVVALLSATTGKEVRSETHRLVKHREHLLLQELSIVNTVSYIIKKEAVTVKIPVALTIRQVSTIGKTAKNILYIDKKTLKYPLVVRKWQKKDYFYPIGMRGKKTVSKYFKDEKLNIISKEEQWLLCSGAAIVWIIGKRADKRFTVSKKTKEILKFTLQK